jgi:GntR family transcriptional regulator, negative regulator for fad regulon and positive regulator of fabA
MKKTHQMVERALVAGFLKGDPKPGNHLQSERELAARFSVSRATVREALVKLQNAGWISVQQRHATVVNDFWAHGDLELLFSITRNSETFPHDLAAHLMELRVQFAPVYARQAVENDAGRLAACLGRSKKLRNSSTAVARFDADLHLTMAVLSGNKIYPLIMNSFSELFQKLKGEFFEYEDNREQALCFYRDLMAAAGSENPDQAEQITRSAMLDRLENFRRRVQVPTEESIALPS